MVKKLPDFRYENELWKKGFDFIAGVDEVGKGCFAGPLVTGCVIFSKDLIGVLSRNSSISTHKGTPAMMPPVARYPQEGGQNQHQSEIIIDDSKKLKSQQRERAAKWIKENALAWGIGSISVQKINSIGMAKAAKIAFRLAIRDARERLGKPIDFLLADAFFISYVPGLPARRRKDNKGRFYKKVTGRQKAIINGDEKSFSIAAASIIAKVYRDSLMVGLSKKPKYRKYGWDRNKGYGTREHQNAIKKYGVTKQHRKLWVETWMNKAQSRTLKVKNTMQN